MGVFKKKSSYHRCYWCLPSASQVGCSTPSMLYRLPLFSTAKSFHFLLASWSRVSCCRKAPQLTSYFLQHLFLFGRAKRDPESLEMSHLLPSSAPFYAWSLESLPAYSFFFSQIYRKRWSMCWNRQIPEKSSFSWRGWQCGLNHSRTDVVCTGRVTDNCQLKSSGLFWLTRIYVCLFLTLIP